MNEFDFNNFTITINDEVISNEIKKISLDSVKVIPEHFKNINLKSKEICGHITHNDGINVWDTFDDTKPFDMITQLKPKRLPRKFKKALKKNISWAVVKYQRKYLEYYFNKCDIIQLDPNRFEIGFDNILLK